MTNFNNQEAEDFAEKTLTMLNGAMLGIMMSIGHRTNLFETMAHMEASTSQEIAETAGLNERYVREWLSAMVSGGVVEYNVVGHVFQLPVTSRQVV